MQAGVDVERLGLLDGDQRLTDQLLVNLVREVLLEALPFNLNSPVPGTMRTRTTASDGPPSAFTSAAETAPGRRRLLVTTAS